MAASSAGPSPTAGFLNITISDCIFDKCRGFALETADGARLEDVTFTGITMRGVRGAPLFLRLESRMRGPEAAVPGTLKRVLMSNITSHDADPMPSIIAGIAGHRHRRYQAERLLLPQHGLRQGHSRNTCNRSDDRSRSHRLWRGSARPEEQRGKHSSRVGSGLSRTQHVRRPERERPVRAARPQPRTHQYRVRTPTPSDSRPACWLVDDEGADLFRLKLPHRAQTGQFLLHNVRDFRVFGCQHYKDSSLTGVEDQLV